MSEHGESCSCGCHHDHHDHHHSHEGITTTLHDGAIAISGERNLQGNSEQIKEKLIDEIKELTIWVETNGGIVGHIKGYVRGGGNEYMISSTEGDIECKITTGTTINVSLAAIIFNVDEKEAECAVAHAFEELS